MRVAKTQRGVITQVQYIRPLIFSLIIQYRAVVAHVSVQAVVAHCCMAADAGLPCRYIPEGPARPAHPDSSQLAWLGLGSGCWASHGGGPPA